MKNNLLITGFIFLNALVWFLIFCGITGGFGVDAENQEFLIKSEVHYWEAPLWSIENIGYRTITAYSSTPDQTDDTPFITASGQMVRRGICATNEFEMGTVLEINGDIYEVQDRTNSRYRHRIDLWMPSREEALEFGVKTLEVKIIK